MLIRNFRWEDIPALMEIQRLVAEAGEEEVMNEAEFKAWLTDPKLDATSNVFVVTDDDDELNTWSQAETLDGMEGEIIGYTTVLLRREPEAYHLRCQGVVHPQHRQRHAGRALLICALNRARILATEFEFEAEQEGHPVYFEAYLPVQDPTSAYLAEKCEMLPAEVANEIVPEGMQLYRCQL